MCVNVCIFLKIIINVFSCVCCPSFAVTGCLASGWLGFHVCQGSLGFRAIMELLLTNVALDFVLVLIGLRGLGAQYWRFSNSGSWGFCV